MYMEVRGIHFASVSAIYLLYFKTVLTVLAKVVSSNLLMARCTRYNIMW